MRHKYMLKLIAWILLLSVDFFIKYGERKCQDVCVHFRVLWCEEGLPEKKNGWGHLYNAVNHYESSGARNMFLLCCSLTVLRSDHLHSESESRGLGREFHLMLSPLLKQYLQIIKILKLKFHSTLSLIFCCLIW